MEVGSACAKWVASGCKKVRVWEWYADVALSSTLVPVECPVLVASADLSKGMVCDCKEEAFSSPPPSDHAATELQTHASQICEDIQIKTRVSTGSASVLRKAKEAENAWVRGLRRKEVRTPAWPIQARVHHQSHAVT